MSKRETLTAVEEIALFTTMYHANRFIFLNVLANDTDCLRFCQERIGSWLGSAREQQLAMTPPPYPITVQSHFLPPENLAFFNQYHIFRQPLFEVVDLFYDNPQHTNALKAQIRNAINLIQKCEHELIKRNQNLIESRIEHLKKGQYAERGDFTRIGNIGLLRAMWRYNVFLLNPKTNTPYKFSTSAFNWIDRALNDANNNQAGVKMPDYLKPILLAINQVKAKFDDEHQSLQNKKFYQAVIDSLKEKSPSTIQYLGLKRVHTAIQNLLLVAGGSTSLDDEKDDTDNLLHYIAYEPETHRNEEAMFIEEIETLSKESNILEILSEREWTIIKLHLGIGMNGYPLNYQEISELLGIKSKQRVQTLIAIAHRTLRQVIAERENAKHTNSKEKCWR